MNGRDTEKQSEPIVIVFCADDNCATLLAVAMRSLLHNAHEQTSIDLYIFDGGISAANKQWILRIADVDHISARIHWIQPDMNRLGELEAKHGVPKASYLRLLIPDVLPESCDKAIYLDSDILIRTDLSRLWNEEIGDKAVLAVRDPCVPTVSAPRGVTAYQTLGLRPDTPYFNSGVMVLNLKEWREKRISEQALRYESEFGPSMFWDQEGLNGVIGGNWGGLDPRWNVISPIFFGERYGDRHPYFEEIMSLAEDLIEQAYIFHFTGPKPADDACDHPARIVWHRYHQDSRQNASNAPRQKPAIETSTANAESKPGDKERDADVDSETDEMLRLYRQLQDWIGAEKQTKKDIAALMSTGDSFILADEGNFGQTIAGSCQAIPFPERNGEYWGPPADDAEAIAEFERLAAAGASYIVVAWPAFWWLEYYPGFESYLGLRYPCVLNNDRLKVFELNK
jgi:lipopolysaccharide biosynthesis glycosyltransferase